jgi:hypothetical protein
MAANDQIEERVLQHLRRHWPQIVPATDFRQDLGLRDQQVLDIGEELAMEMGCRPTRTQIVGCHTVNDLIVLLRKTKFTASVATLRSAAKLAATPYPAAVRAPKTAGKGNG